jgi:ABC-type long-subunit fatty acid transport system fused permease/ATPase subunit
MGEAKRRKQILGESYGNFPSVLIEGTPQWKKHILKFYEAWQKKWAELLEIEQDKNEKSQENSKQQDFAQIKEELKKWLVEYLSIYRAKDQEQLVSIVMDEHYEELSELLIEAEESNNSEKAQKFSQKALGWVMLALVYFSLLSPYLSPESASEYADPLNSFYQMMISEKRQEGSDEKDVEARAILFSEALGSYFQESLTIESVLDAPLDLSYSHPKREVLN